MDWTPKQDRKLKQLLDAGLSASEAAEKLGVTRNAVIGRKNRIARTIFPCDLRQRERAATGRLVREHKRNCQQASALAVLHEALASGKPRNAAIIAALDAGATLRTIGDVFGVSRQRIEQIRNRGLTGGRISVESR